MEDFTKTQRELETAIEKAEKKKKYYEHWEKILKKKVIPELTRKARTNRLCTRAGMLESFLVHPEFLTNDQVMELLRIAFRQKEVKDALAKMIEPFSEDYEESEEAGSEEGENAASEETHFNP